jgi:GrpB-like predicted nucleotidyltransferase (UPF0157 family)
MDEIEIVPYDPDWPALYEAERGRLLPVLDGFGPVAIAHVGSTAVPGLAAKPVIDIAATVPALDDLRRRGIAALVALGYCFWAENPDPGELFFVRGLPPHGARRTHHLHITEPGERFARRLRFRDRLRADAEMAQRYAALKRNLAAHFAADREAYTEAKTDFITAALGQPAGLT